MFKELFEAKKEKEDKIVNFFAYTKDAGGSSSNMYRVSSNMTMRSNHSSVALAITNLQWMVKREDVQAETGNVGTANYRKYFKKRFHAARAKSKNPKEFAKNLNKEFGVTNFTDKPLFEIKR